MVTRIQQAAKLARSRSSKLSSFSNSYELLKGTQQQPQVSIPRRVVFLTDSKSTSLLCDSIDTKFLFDDTWASGQEVVETLHTNLVDIHFVKQIPRERRNVSFRELADTFTNDATSLAYLGHVFTTLDLYNNSKYCSRCGHPRTSLTMKPCVICSLQKYHRISPVSMVLVHDPSTSSILLGKKPGSKRWSTIAGFCESLESIENCAVREAFEEARVKVNRETLEIGLTQPWPLANADFEGTALMVGCFAETSESGQIPHPVDKELEDVKWFTEKELKNAWDNKETWLPFKSTMAHYLLGCFLDSK